LYPEPWPKFVPGSWSKNLGWSPSSEGAPGLNCQSGGLRVASDGQLTGTCPLGLTWPKSTSATAVPPSVPGRYAISSASASAAGPSPRGRPAMITTITGFPVASSAAIKAC
jgi:hypothetical protein